MEDFLVKLGWTWENQVSYPQCKEYQKDLCEISIDTSLDIATMPPATKSKFSLKYIHQTLRKGKLLNNWLYKVRNMEDSNKLLSPLGFTSSVAFSTYFKLTLKDPIVAVTFELTST